MSQPLVFITGASSGLGQALALRYYRAGWRLALIARRTELVDAWVAQQGVQAQRVRIWAADVADNAALRDVGAACIAELGVPDVVIANAGISVGMDTAEFDDLAVMRQIFETNNVGLAATFHAFVAPMRERGSGTLVGVASVAGIRGLPGHGAYCASKAGVIAYCESLRGDLRSAGVRVVTLVPGYIDTPLTQKNRYSMPFLMSADDFAAAAYRAITAQASYRVIPWQMGWIAKLLRALPDAWFDRLFANRARKARRPT